MELVGLLRVLLRHRLLVLLGAAVALLPGYMLATKPASHAGVASVRVVLDTPQSEILNAVPVGADSLGWRAAILGDLMGTAEIRARVERDLHAPAHSLAVVAPHLTIPATETPLSRRAMEVAAITTEPYVLSIQSDDPLPIVSINTTAPDRDRAGRLAKAAIAELAAASIAPSGTQDVQRYSVKPIGPVRAKAITGGARRSMGPIVTVVLFGAWCVCIAFGSGLRRVWRRTAPAAAAPTS